MVASLSTAARGMQASRHVRSLTSLRFFAAAMIVLGHGGSRAHFNYSIDLIDVRQAVSFFFVLSGFILSHAYDTLDWRTGYRAFIAARIGRIWPAHAVTALIAALTVAPIGTAADLVKAMANVLLVHAAIPLTAWHYSLNAPSWSISAEMFFYAAFPFALALARRRPGDLLPWALALVAAAVGLATALGLAPIETAPGITAWGVLYISPFTRVAEFVTGITAHRLALGACSHTCTWSTRRATFWEVLALGLVLAAMAGITWLANAHAVGAFEQLAVWARVAGPFPLFALMLAVFYPERGWLTRALSSRGLVYLGEISFALYLVHQLVIRNMFAFARPPLDHWGRAYLLYWIGSLAAAVLLHHLVENPLRPRVTALLAGGRPRTSARIGSGPIAPS